MSRRTRKRHLMWGWIAWSDNWNVRTTHLWIAYRPAHWKKGVMPMRDDTQPHAASQIRNRVARYTALCGVQTPEMPRQNVTHRPFRLGKGYVKVPVCKSCRAIADGCRDALFAIDQPMAGRG